MTLILSGTDGLSDVDGTAATPAIRGTDANTGIFFGTDIIGFSEGGVEAMRIDSDGDVGIGTSSPVNKLQVAGAVAATGGAGGYAANMALLDVSGGNAQITAIGANTSTIGTLVFQAFSSNASLGAERARIPSTGGIQSVNSISVGNATPTTSGAGITFPATQSASSDANTLDDYEEGTFTPTIIGSTTAGTGTYSTHQVGAYTKVGRAVTIQIRLSWTAHTGTGSMLVSGLPFTILSGGVQPSFTVGDARDIALTASNILQLFSDTNVTTIQFIQTPTGGGASGNVPIDTSATIILSGTYFTS